MKTTGCVSVLLLLASSSVEAFAAPLPHTRAVLPTSSRSISQLHALPASAHWLVPRGGEVSDLVQGAYDWCTNLGAPAALVAGAVIATIYETLNSGSLDPKDSDTRLIRIAKRVTRFLLLSAFALEVMSIFMTTVTGTMLMSRTLDIMDDVCPISKDTTPLSFLQSNFEFEYLSANVTFLQGILHWMIAIALDHIIPLESETPASRRMSKFIASTLVSTCLLMLSFFNGHLTFYDNYAHMLVRWFHVTVERFVLVWPPRPLAIVLGPMLIYMCYMGWQAFFYREAKPASK